jgi:hypothetical protein
MLVDERGFFLFSCFNLAEGHEEARVTRSRGRRAGKRKRGRRERKTSFCFFSIRWRSVVVEDEEEKKVREEKKVLSRTKQSSYFFFSSSSSSAIRERPAFLLAFLPFLSLRA